MGAVRIMVCDDSSFARKSVVRAIPPDPSVQVSEAADGAEALRACLEGRVDVLFMDLNMPGMGGIEVLERLRQAGSQVAVITVSADIQQRQQERVRELGALAFICKPVKPQDISTVLEYLKEERAR